MTDSVGTRIRRASIGLLLLNAVGLAAFTLPQEVQASRLQEQLDTLRREQDRQKRTLDTRQKKLQAEKDNVADVVRFSKLLKPRETALVPVLETIEKLARESGLRPQTRSYQEEREPRTDVVRVRVRLPLEGRYAQLVSLIEKLESAPDIVSVDQIAMRSDQGKAALQLQLSAYFKAPGEGR